MSNISEAVKYMVDIANSPKHGYNQWDRWGNPKTVSDYDCSSLVISAYEAAGVPVKSKGATYTGNMYSVFLKCGFKDITKDINLATGKGLEAGDVLLNHECHTAMMIDSKRLAQASIDERGDIKGGKPGDQTGQEINIRSYYSYPWNVVLRYPTLDTKGYIKGQSTIGVYNMKQLLILAKEKGYITQGVNDDKKFGKGTQNAVNELLRKWHYNETGIAGINFSRKLRQAIAKIK